MPDQTGFFANLKNAAGKVFTYLASITLTGVDGKTLPVNDSLTLALGAANLKHFMNAAGTNLEWASGIKVGSFTKNVADAAGDVAYTGVGFKPSAIIFLAYATHSISIGIDDGTTHGLVGGMANPMAPYIGAFAFELHVVDGTDNTKAIVKTMDADGFTITYTKVATPTGTFTIYYLALR